MITVSNMFQLKCFGWKRFRDQHVQTVKRITTQVYVPDVEYFRERIGNMNFL